MDFQVIHKFHEFNPISFGQVQLLRMGKHSQFPLLLLGFDQGDALLYNYQKQSVKLSISLYNSQVIDIKDFKAQYILTSTHDQITLTNYQKPNIRKSLQAHQQSIFHLAVHPFSPIVASVSNVLLLHDVRTKKPFSINFSVSEPYNLEFSNDGHWILVGGQPLRIAYKDWKRTLVGGTGKFSQNGKFIINLQKQGNFMDLWDWMNNSIVRRFDGFKADKYQVPELLQFDNSIKACILSEQGRFLIFDVMSNKLNYDLNLQIENYTSIMYKMNNLHNLFCYSQRSCDIKCYNLYL